MPDRPAIAIFTGEGIFRLKPAVALEERYLSRIIGKPELEETFDSAVFFFSDDTYQMDVDGSHNMGWFTREWIYGTDLPRYRLEYSLKTMPDGKVRFTGKLSQSDVSPEFVMRMPIYFDFDGRLFRAGSSVLKGNMTTPEIAVDLPKRPKRVLLSANHDVLAAEAEVKEVQ
jgi:hypothetical protein